MIEWLRTVSLMDQLAEINANAIREAIERTNYMVTNRVKASRSIKFKRTKNITTDGVSHPLYNAKTVSMTPELSLSAIGTEIPVIEMPPGMPYPKLIETANIMTLIGQMAMHRPIPRERIKQLGDNTSKIPSIYNRGLSALGFCQSIMNR